MFLKALLLAWTEIHNTAGQADFSVQNMVWQKEFLSMKRMGGYVRKEEILVDYGGTLGRFNELMGF